MTEDTKTKVPPVVKRIAEQTPESPVPICVLVVGMAGSGKTTLMSQLQHSSMDNVDHEGTNEEGEAAVIKRKTEETVDKKPSPSSETDERSENQGIGETDSMPAYCINLDPATLDVPYSPSIDIRDTVDYKQVMKQHRLGPNGGNSSLNLYATEKAPSCWFGATRYFLLCCCCFHWSYSRRCC